MTEEAVTQSENGQQIQRSWLRQEKQRHRADHGPGTMAHKLYTNLSGAFDLACSYSRPGCLQIEETTKYSHAGQTATVWNRSVT